jgi:hypothetical protein
LATAFEDDLALDFVAGLAADLAEEVVTDFTGLEALLTGA